jgi:hypothetical protein
MMRAEQRCPYLIPVTADRVWMYPVSAFCRRPEGAIKVPAARTLERTCSTPAYAECVGFLASLVEDARADGC